MIIYIESIHYGALSVNFKYQMLFINFCRYWLDKCYPVSEDIQTSVVFSNRWLFVWYLVSWLMIVIMLRICCCNINNRSYERQLPKVQDYRRCKTTKGSRLPKVQDYRRCKTTKGARLPKVTRLPKVQDYRRCKTTEGD